MVVYPEKNSMVPFQCASGCYPLVPQRDSSHFEILLMRFGSGIRPREPSHIAENLQVPANGYVKMSGFGDQDCWPFWWVSIAVGCSSWLVILFGCLGLS